MMKRVFFNPVALSSLIVIFVIGAWLMVLPVQLAGQAKLLIEQRTGRTFEIAGAPSLVFAPGFSLVLRDVKLAGASALADPVVTAQIMSIPLSFTALLGRMGPQTEVVLDGADVVVALNAQGHANVVIDQNPTEGKTDIDAPETMPVMIKIQTGMFHYRDDRVGSRFDLPQFSGEFAFTSSGAVTASGSAEINARHATFTLALKSLQRVFDDGSPIDFTLESEGHEFSFSGRIATHHMLNLAGQATIETPRFDKLATWVGVEVTSMPADQKFSVDGAFESEGSDFAFKNARVRLGKQDGVGDVALSLTGDRPNLVAQVKAERVHFDIAVPAGTWSETPVDFSLVKNIDAQFQISIGKFSNGAAELGQVKIDGVMKSGILKTKIAGDVLTDAQIDMDALQVPPILALTLHSAKIDAKTVFVGQHWWQGFVTFTADLKAHGGTQAELISTLKGNVSAKLETGSFMGVDFKNISIAQQGWSSALVNFISGSALFTIADGIAALQENHLDGEGLSLVAAGEVDILRRSLALSAEPGGPRKILLDGPWANPNISVVTKPAGK